MSKRKLTIGLLWHSLSSGNLGVGALTESNMAIVRGVADRLGLKICFIVFGINDVGIDSLRAELKLDGHDVECRRIRMFRAEFRHSIGECDLVLDIGAGDSFADIYGFKRFFYYWLSKNIVASVGCPLALSPQTIGPFDGRTAQILAKQAMNRAEKVFARDSISSRYLESLGVVKNTAEAVDVAFRLPFTAASKRDGSLIHVGLNVSGLLFNGGYTKDNQFGLTVDYPAVVRALLSNFTTRPNVRVHLVSHVIEPHMPVEDDFRVCQSLAKEFNNTVLAPVFDRPSAVKSYISNLDFFTGARMHACIAAFSSGVPVVPMAYSRKFNGLFGSLGYNTLCDLKAADTEFAIAAVLDGFEAREQLRVDVAAGVALANQKLTSYEDYLESALRRLSA
jgi:colanic acid/amylovoran biosynthesis protein